jgi:hypothetical protein
MTIVVIVILALWLLISALSQLKVRGTSTLRNYDFFSLIPNWSFFAPRPGTSDYHLLFRDCDADGKFGKWQELPLADERTILGAIWNPQKRNKKALSDTVRSIAQISQDKALRAGIAFTIPYLVTLNYISSMSRADSTIQTQFMILKSDGFFSEHDPELVFLSNVHRL